MKICPNILWIVWDCARSDRVSGHGHPRNTTPHLDNLIKSGIDYSSAYSSAIWSLPGYASLLTGSYPRQHQVNSPESYLDPETVTLPQTLREAGYHTTCFSNNAWLSNFTGSSNGFAEFNELWFSAQKTYRDKFQFLWSRLQGYLVGDADKNARMTNARIVKHLKANRGKPYFLFSAYMEPHWPYTFHPRTSRQVLTREERNVLKGKLNNDVISWWCLSEYDQEVLAETRKKAELLYDIEMRYLDTQTHNLLKRLEAEGLLENTIVVITADHGELLGEQGVFGHQFNVLEPVRHVPLILWSPDLLPKGQVINDIVQTTDIARTICDLCDVPWEGNVDGTFLLPMADGEGKRKTAITDYPIPLLEPVTRRYPEADLSKIDRGLTTISNASYKIVQTSKGGRRAYHASDFDEQNALSPDHSQEVRELSTLLDAYLSYNVALTSQSEELPDDLRKHLEALGYL